MNKIAAVALNHCHHHQHIIGATIPEDVRVREKEDEKEEKYQDLAREVGKMWRVRTKVVPVVFFSSSRHRRARHHDLPVVPV